MHVLSDFKSLISSPFFVGCNILCNSCGVATAESDLEHHSQSGLVMNIQRRTMVRKMLNQKDDL